MRLTGTLVTSVSYNYILNSGCTQSVAEMEKRHDEYVETRKKYSQIHNKIKRIIKWFIKLMNKLFNNIINK